MYRVYNDIARVGTRVKTRICALGLYRKNFSGKMGNKR